jgi:nitronate monooxygenase
MADTLPPLARARAFCDAFALRVPILMAPMAGACPASLAIAVANGGGLGGCGALLMKPEAIRAWTADVRAQTNGAFQINLWIPDPAPKRDAEHEARVREFLGQWGPAVSAEAGDVTPIDFAAQCEAMLEAGPAIVSSIMGVYPADVVARMKDKGIRWFANVTTVAEAREAVAAGADVIVAQGMEAGGHRGSFDAERPDTALVGLFALLPAIVCRWSPLAGLPMRAGLRQRFSSARRRCKSGRACSERPRQSSRRPGPTRSARRSPRTPRRHVRFPAGSGAASRPPM